ncbi:PulJ/GspJ family protein [Tenacibaculum finnmarkense]|uniref:PulJ/GspJ family protein n=1 Tax=Tenacibaculum finnmarkense TaxID=2781243 RepID=UPI001E510AB3|nr:prepilin-type N-terminal cleavage/methylation domain-containing protein [Tenacibaculum finnmarkense]MCD8406214.1 prepilin-type N-terminal cleavage/methylation domain-containing protein [Tenacibaculum dicentrarchi]MCD8413264.1 prepilin-type N-terminal cleavage/methylation domain-containing protein [Tenacibaculum finnmarkense genomovar ulcerans]MCG8208217.1 prepilin-type N-terminal cleavage/methylation domain-containing protein [Tenacibaculum finnmarkense genomovar finnmarkense]MCG8724231.1 hy
MKLTKKIPAFTLSEMLVVLVVSTIVISLAFVTLTMVQKQVSVIKHNFHIRQESQFLERILWHDFNNYTAKFQQQENKLLLYNSIDSVEYIFNDTFIFRNNDTLHLQIKNKQLFLDGNIVTQGVIDAISLETSVTFNNNKLFVYKTKDASHYLNSN